MSIRGFGDAYAIQRLLWLLVGTVILPTILLALYGVTAIRAQQSALLDRLRGQEQEALQSAARLLFDEIAHLDAQMHAGAAGCADPAGACVEPRPGVAKTWAWTTTAPPDLVGILPERAAGSATVWYVPPEGAPIGLFADSGRSVAYRLDPDHLRQRLQTAARVGPEMEFLLEGPRPGPATPYDEMRARWEGPTPELVLERPLAQWRLRLAGEDPGTILGWSSWLYAAGLVVLVGLVLVGALVTLGSAAREIRLSRLQTDFVSNVSHELRTPLTSIKMFVETLQSGRIQDPEKVEECLTLLSQETERLSRRIERVLGWARMEGGRRIYEYETVTVRVLVDEAIRAVRSQTLLDEVEFAVDIPDALPALRADRDAMVEALVNLLQNAVRYTPPPRRIAVRAERRGSRVGIAVEDNGPGIARRHRKRIFEKFYQADNLLATPSSGRGTGLGLAIVRAVVRGHGGRVDLDTEEGRGSRFTLWLPASGRPR